MSPKMNKQLSITLLPPISLLKRNHIYNHYRFLLRTAQFQYPNVYKHYKSHSMESMLFVPLSLRPFKFSFQQLHCFLQLQSCFTK